MSKITMITDYRDGNPYQKELADSLEQEGHQIQFLSEKENFFRKTVRDDTSIVHFHWLAQLIYSENLIKTMFRFFVRVVELFFLRLKGKKMVWTIHNLEAHESRYPRTERLFKIICAKYFFDNIIVHCDRSRDQAIQSLRTNKEKFRVIPHGNYIESYPNNYDKDKAREYLDLDPESTVFLHFGRIRRYKQVDKVIEQFKRTESEEACLLVVGKSHDKSLKKEIEDQIGSDERIKIVDQYIQPDEIHIYMNACDALVLGYKDITTSGTVILGMSFGKPVVAPKKGCIPQQLSQTSSMVYNSINELSEKLEFAQESDLQKIGERNYKTAKNQSWDLIGEKTSELYSELDK
mgnify:CR=1 FL=1